MKLSLSPRLRELAMCGVAVLNGAEYEFHHHAPEFVKAGQAMLTRDYPGNPALVRDYTGVRGELLDGKVRFRYYISHDRLIPQGGFITANGVTIPLPPPPV